MKFKKFLNREKLTEMAKKLSICEVLTPYQKELLKITEVAILDVDKKLYDIALSFITKKINVKKKDLIYIGYSDLSWSKPGRKLLQFNIMDPNHLQYKSTVSYDTDPKNRR